MESSPSEEHGATAAGAPTKEGVSYHSVRPLMQTFDLAWFRGASPLSKIILGAQEMVGGPGAGAFSHVGVIIMGDAFPPESPFYTPPGEGNIPYVFEAQDSTTEEGDGIANVHGTRLYSVQLRNLDEVVAKYDMGADTKMAWGHMLEARRPSTLGWPEVFARYDGAAYDRDLDLAASAFCCCRPLRWLIRCCNCGGRREDDEDRLICSELAANVYRDLGALPPGVDPENVIPSDFLARGGGNTTHDADGEIPVLFHNPVVFTCYPRAAVAPAAAVAADQN